MARARNIKPSLFKNELLGVADPLLTLLFEGLWLLADREGRLEDRPMRIKAEVFPYRDSVNVDQMLGWLHDNGFIFRYSVDSKGYIEVCNFSKHQNPHKNEAESEIPDKSEGYVASKEIGTTSEKIGTAPADSLIPDSLNLIPDSLTLSQAPDAPSQESLFDQFWKLYPRKTAKAKACREWLKIKPDQALFAKIMEALAAHAASRDWLKDGGQFIPHPSTWLHQKRWEDELLPSNVHPLPSRHNGFEGRNYRDGLTERGDGTYDF